jgi:hypothetical protein
MSLISGAEQALVRNWRSVLFYIVACVVVVAIYRLAGNQMDRVLTGVDWPAAAQLEAIQPKPEWYTGGELFADIAIACLVGVFQAIAYARLGRDIDKPLWKCRDDRDAVVRFALIWVMFNLLNFALFQFQSTLYTRGFVSASGIIGVIALLWNLLYVPAGVCLMHHGGLKNANLGEALMPMLHFLPRTLLLMGLGFLQLVLFEMLVFSVSEPMRALPWVIGAFNVPIIYLECLGVAIMWMSCSEYRAVAAEQQDDDDFDF